MYDEYDKFFIKISIKNNIKFIYVYIVCDNFYFK